VEVGVLVAGSAVGVFVEAANEGGTDVFVGRTVAGAFRHEVIKEINMAPDRTTMIFSLVDMRSAPVQLWMRA
jgi:hypothetical protein